jgi:hypothetical protein
MLHFATFNQLEFVQDVLYVLFLEKRHETAGRVPFPGQEKQECDILHSKNTRVMFSVITCHHLLGNVDFNGHFVFKK